MRNCPACGTLMPDNTPACPACGVQQPPAPPAGPAAPQQPAPGFVAQGQGPLYGQGMPNAPGPQGGMPPYGAPPPGMPGGRPPFYGQLPPQNGMPPAGGPPPKKNRTGLVVGIVCGAVALVAIIVLLVVFVFMKDSDTPASSSTSSQSQASSSSRSRPQPSGSSSQPGSNLPTASTFYWELEPTLDYDAIEPVPGWRSLGNGLGYINFYKDGQSGLADFFPNVALDEISNPYFPLYSGNAFFCDFGGLHNMPFGIDEMPVDEANEYLASLGLPFTTDGAHGGGGSFLFAIGADGSLTGGYLDYGEFYVPDGGVPKEYIPNYAPAFYMADLVTDSDGFVDTEAMLFGLASKDGEVLLEPAYDWVYTIVNGVATLEQGGYYGYYSVDEERLIASCQYEAVWQHAAEVNNGAGIFSSGLCPVKVNGKYGFIDDNNDLVVPAVFDNVSYAYQGYAWVQVNGLWGLIGITV